MLLFLVATGTGFAQTSDPGKIRCTINPPEVATDYLTAYHAHDYARAEELAREDATKNAADEAAFAKASDTVIRALLAQHKEREAIAFANTSLERYKNNAVLLDALGEAYFRRGEVDKATVTFNAAMKADPCNARTHYDFAMYEHLDAQFATEQKQIEVAHVLAPTNRNISRAARAVTTSTTLEERIQRLQDRLDDTSLPENDRAAAQRTLAVLQSKSHGSCEVVHPMENATIPLASIANGPTDMYAVGLQLQLNGKSKRFELDTGASGLMLSRSVAKAAGLISEAQSSSFGIGDQGARTVDLAHIDSIRIGPLEFHNCLVRIFEKNNVLDVDGLIGGDVFASWVVTIDTPQRQLRLSPLPKRPEEVAAPATLDTSGSGADEQTVPHNRYIAPEMKNWTPVFRSGHELLFPTNINGGPTRLFMMDTGASNEGLISLAAAREVTRVGDSDRRIHGISGTVQNVGTADTVTIAFGGVREQLHNVSAIDMSRMGHAAGTEISGLIGFYTLRELVISIDYRDSLVHVVYDPKHGFHNRR